ncbi:MAG TPA: hypothetical protein VLZ78_02655 [Terrimesophilobacter sp.]|nr:hypothetical protein [Terrimesophilobacter sp.]
MTWKHVAVIAMTLATLVLCSRAGCAERAGEIAGYVAVGVIGNVGTTAARRLKKKTKVKPGGAT